MSTRRARAAGRLGFGLLLALASIFYADVAAYASGTVLAGTWAASGGPPYGAPTCTYTGTWTPPTGSGTITCTTPSGATGGLSIQLAGQAYQAGNGGTITYSSLPNTSPIDIFVMNSSGGSVYGTFHATNSQAPNASPPSACPTGNYTVTSSYVGTSLSTRVVLGSGVSFPAGGLRVDAPGSGIPSSYPATATQIILSGATVDGQPGTYYSSVTVSSLSPLQEYVTPLDSSGAPICYVGPVTPSSNQISPTAPSTGSDDGSNGTSSHCGFGWNIFSDMKCAARWAFYCDSTCMSGWQSHVNDIKSRPPLSVLTSMSSFLTDTVTAVECNATSSCAGPSNITDIIYHDPDSGASLDIVDEAGQLMDTTTGGQVIYRLEETGLWVGFIFYLWTRVGKSFGSKDST